MRLCSVVFLCLAVVGVSHGDELSSAISKIIDAPEYKASRWGLLVVDSKSGKTLYERDPDKFFLPASTTKLYSCATALHELGPDHRFKTPVYQNGTVTDGVLKGDLILVASGDPTMGGRRGKDGKMQYTDNDHTYAGSGLGQSTVTETDPLFGLNDLAKQIRKKGITEISGEIIVDDGLFGKARSSGSGPEMVTPIVINDNVVDVIVTPADTDGQPAKITMRPSTEFVDLDAKVSTGAVDAKPNLIFRVSGSNRLSIRGLIPLKTPPQVRIYPVEAPELYARALFIEALRKNGVLVRASIKSAGDHLPPTKQYDKLVKVAEFESEPLSELLKVTLKVSHNLYASSLPIFVGLKHHRGTVPKGLEQQAKMLQSMSVDPASVSFAGGAGGANADSTTPRATVSLIKAMSKHKHAEIYFDCLPVMGVDGTLAGIVPKESPVYGKCRAKTGTLLWGDVQNDRLFLRSKALAGEIKTAKGSTVYFSMFLNDFPLPPGGTAAQQGKVLGKVAEAIHLNAP